METSASRKNLYDIIPIADVLDGALISRRGNITLGWELTLPVIDSLMEDGYNEMVESFASAIRILPDWTLVHRQDVYTHETYHGEYSGDYLSDCYSRHFEGRRYLCHRSFLYVTMAEQGNALVPNSRTAFFGFPTGVPKGYRERLSAFSNKCDEFISVLTAGGRIAARPLTSAELAGDGGKEGLVDAYLTCFQNEHLRSDYVVSPDRIRVLDKIVLGFKLSEAEQFKGDEVSNVVAYSSRPETYQLWRSAGSPVGSALDCDHIVNQYILLPNQQQVTGELERRRRRMRSMIDSPDNEANYDQVTGFIREVNTFGRLFCYSHMNVLAWCSDGEELEVQGRLSAAMTAMGLVAVRALSDLPSLFLAGCPGGAPEVGKDNFLLGELTGMLCLMIGETFEKGVPDGSFRICDRIRNIPVRLDFQSAARSLREIDNYNVFLLGPSGTGKSFFTNFLLQQGYAAGETVFVIDVGHSYEGLCQLINESSGGRDGIYLTWDPERPFSFNPFIGWESWLTPSGHLKMEEDGVSFFMSFLKTLWQPQGGWTADANAVIEQIVGEFIAHCRKTLPEGTLPVFDEFYRFLVEVIQPRILPVLDRKGSVKSLPADPLVVGGSAVTPVQFDVVRFIRSLYSYSAEGAYSFLLNERKPKDLFSSRFTVFEVHRLSEGDPLFYSVCILCIMHAFDLKMRKAPGFKRMVVDEAWKAIANQTMAPYLRGLWKTARKYFTSAMVVTQELDDIISSDVIKKAILMNSDIKILLNQEKNANKFENLSSLLGLSEHQKNLILSMGHDHNPKYLYHDAYISTLRRYGVYAIEASREQALAFESEHDKKEPYLLRAKELGSLRAAIEETAAKGRKSA